MIELPDSVEMKLIEKYDLVEVIKWLENSIENSIELLNIHMEKLGKTTRPNQHTAELYEDEILAQKELLEKLRKY